MELLQALYDPNGMLPKDTHFYKQALQEIQCSAVSSQFYFLLKQEGKLGQTPPFFQERLKQLYNEAMYLNLFIKSQTEQILHEFENCGIEVIPLKGTVFAEKYFGHIGARPTSDIDLLVKPPDLEKAIERVKLVGFTVEEEPIPSHFHCSFSKQLTGSPVPLTVELHWDLLKQTNTDFKIEEFWESAKPIKKFLHVKELSDYHTFYMICLHGWRHNLESLKYFIDIIQLVHSLQGRLDFSLLLRDAASHKTLKRLVRTLSIVYRQFPHLDGVIEFPQKRTKLFWEYKSVNKNERSFKGYLDFFDYQFFSYDVRKHSLGEILNWIMPSKYEIISQIGGDTKERKSFFVMYLHLWKKRVNSVFKTILSLL